MVIDYSEFESAREMRKEMKEFEQWQAQQYAYDGYVPLDEDEMDGFHIITDDEEE